MNQKKLVIVSSSVIVALVVICVSFYGGVRYQKGKSTEFNSNRRGNENFVSGGKQELGSRKNSKIGNGNGINLGEGREGKNRPFESGEITAKDDKSITVKMQDGSTKIVYFSDLTKIGKTVDGSIVDLQVGQSVMVDGDVDSSGAITAQNIQIRTERKFR